MKTRIVKREYPNGRIEYVIQQKHWLFRWKWVDAWHNYLEDVFKNHFNTLGEAKANLCYFNNSKPKDTVVKL